MGAWSPDIGVKTQRMLCTHLFISKMLILLMTHEPGSQGEASPLLCCLG